MSFVWMWGTEDVDCILQQVEQFRYGNVEALNWCQGTTFATNFPHPMSSGFRGYMELSGRLGDARYDRVERSFRARGIDVLQLLVDRCHEMGVKLYVSERTAKAARPTSHGPIPSGSSKTAGDGAGRPTTPCRKCGPSSAT